MRYDFGEVVQNFELKRIGGAPKGHQFANLLSPCILYSKVILWNMTGKQNIKKNGRCQHEPPG